MAGRWRDGIQSGDRASQPAFGDVAIGTLYFVTDEGVLERSTGAAWVEVALNTTAHDAHDHTGVPGVGGGGGTLVGAKVYNDAATIATTGPLAFDAEDWDTDNFHDNVTNNSRLTIPAGKSGKYLVQASTWCSRTDANLEVHVNGSVVRGRGRNSANTANNYGSCLAVVDVGEGHYIQIVGVVTTTTTFGDAGSIGDHLVCSITKIG